MNAVTRRSPFGASLLFIACVTTASCAFERPQAVFDAESAVETRSVQTRTLNVDRDIAMRAVIETLQDLGFVIDNADAALGTITGTKLARYEVRMTVSVRERGDQVVDVRASAQYAEPMSDRPAVPIEDPLTYQDFFQALDRSTYLSVVQAR